LLVSRVNRAAVLWLFGYSNIADLLAPLGKGTVVEAIFKVGPNGIALKVEAGDSLLVFQNGFQKLFNAVSIGLYALNSSLLALILCSLTAAGS